MDRVGAFVVLLAVLCCCARGQVVTISLPQQTTDTKVGLIVCDTVQGFFTITVFNGFTEDRNFYAQGQTSGVGQGLTATPGVVSIPARTSGNLFLYGPSTGAQGQRSIVGRSSLLQVYMMGTPGDPSNPGTSLVGSNREVCGGNFSNQCDCGFANLPCMLDDCSPETFAMFWIYLCLAFVIIVTIIGWFFISNFEVVLGSLFDHFHSKMSTNVQSPDQTYEAKYRAALRNGTMDEDAMRRRMLELKSRVESPEAQQRLHQLEDMHRQQMLEDGMNTGGAYNVDDEPAHGMFSLANDSRMMRF